MILQDGIMFRSSSVVLNLNYTHSFIKNLCWGLKKHIFSYSDIVMIYNYVLKKKLQIPITLTFYGYFADGNTKGWWPEL